MYERVDIIFVVSRPMVGVLLYVVQVLDHMAEDTRLTIVIEAAGVIVIIIMMKSIDEKDLQNEINKKNETISGESCFVALGTILYFQFRQKGKGAIYMGKRACICQFLDFGAT